MDANMKRKLTRVVAILAVALGAGQVMQSMSHSDAKPKLAEDAAASIKLKDVQPVVADPQEVAPTVQPSPVMPAPHLPDAGLAATTPAAAPPPTIPPAPAAPAQVADLPQTAAPLTPVVPAQTQPVASADPCAITLDLANEPNGMIGVSLVAGCHPNERVVIQHGGLAVTGKTTAAGSLFVDLPAMTVEGAVEVLFKDGARTKSAVAMPELAGMRRFAVQWQGDDRFLIHGFEDEQGYGGPGDVSAASPHHPVAGMAAKGGFLTVLGDASTDAPLLAEVYTYPADPSLMAEVVVEAPVTAKACNRAILGDTLISNGGKVTVSDLEAAMPGCDAVGDYLVLKNLVADMNIAAN